MRHSSKTWAQLAPHRVREIPGNYGIYLVWEGKFYEDTPGTENGFYAFARGSVLPADRNFVSVTTEAGALYKGVFRRGKDACPRKNMPFVAIKMGRRQGGPSRTGGRSGAYLNRYATDEQRSRRPIFIATLRAAASWLFFRVARSSRINLDIDMLVARALKNSQLTGGESFANQVGKSS